MTTMLIPGTRGDLAGEVNERLADRGAPHRVAVAALRVRDELAAVEPAPERVDPWTVPVHLDGATAIVGPLPTGVGPGCSRCLARRWQLVRSATVRDALELGGETHAAGVPPFATGFAAELIAAVVSAAQPAPDRLKFVYLVDLARARIRRVRLVPDALCPACGDRRPDAPERVVLTPAPKPSPDTYRLRALADFDVPVDGYVNEVCGVLGRGVLRELDLPSTSTVIGSITGRAEPDLYEIFWGGHANSFSASLRIGIFEGLERYSGMSPRARCPVAHRSLRELTRAGEAVLDPRDCGVYSDELYDSDPEAVPFDESRPIPWTWGYSLRDDRPILVPQVLTYYHCAPQHQRFVQECSNGCASGSSLVEATFYGLLEVVERDAFLLTWYGRAPLGELDPRTSRRPATRAMVERLAMYGYTARFFDARVSFPLPVVIGAAVRADGRLGTMCFGAGAGLDPEEALAAALVEIATDSLHLPRRTRFDEARLRRMAADFTEVAALDDHPRLYGLPEMAGYAAFLLDRPGVHPRPLSEAYAGTAGGTAGAGRSGVCGGQGRQFGTAGAGRSGVCGGQARQFGTDDLAEDLRGCVAMVADAGFDVIVVDQTAPEQRPLGLHTASVIVPGLLPIDFGWRRQRARHLERTRTALTRSGLRGRDLRPDELNPAPHPFP